MLKSICRKFGDLSIVCSVFINFWKIAYKYSIYKKTKPNNSGTNEATSWKVWLKLVLKFSKVFAESLVIFQLFVPFLWKSIKQHKNIKYGTEAAIGGLITQEGNKLRHWNVVCDLYKWSEWFSQIWCLFFLQKSGHCCTGFFCFTSVGPLTPNGHLLNVYIRPVDVQKGRSMDV